jgi:hypothetical protein
LGASRDGLVTRRVDLDTISSSVTTQALLGLVAPKPSSIDSILAYVLDTVQSLRNTSPCVVCS